MMYRRERHAVFCVIKALAAMAGTVAAGTAYGWLLVQLGRAVL